MNLTLISLASFLALASSNSVLLSTHLKQNEVNNAAPTSTILKIYNWADYIASDVLQEFHDYVLATDKVDLTIVYETFDTNEIMLSQLQTGSASYDLICPSDYMIQRMMASNLLIPFASGADRDALYGERKDGWDDNYSLYASKYLQNKFASISSPIGDTGKTGTLAEYARGYMWGTLGILYNPSFSTFASRGLSEDDVKVQMNDWNSLWEDQYKGTFQIKDSMRDTYSVGLMKAYDSYFLKLKAQYEEDGDKDAYNEKVTTLFNNITHVDSFNSIAKELDSNAKDATTDSIIDGIEGYLSSLKDNSYGLEVDSGKTDITDGKMSGIGMAWSGDAVYSMDTADTLGNTLYYSIPKTGGNIWFDGWVIPKNCSNQEYAQKFVDFISQPSIAAEDMDYIGYSSSIAGDDILSLVREWYDPRLRVIYAYDETADSYYLDDNGDYVPNNGQGEVTIKIDNEDHVIDYGAYDFTSVSDFHDLYNNCGQIGEHHYDSWEDYAQNDEQAQGETWTKVNLSYLFDGSFSSESGFEDGIDDIFYTTEVEEVTGKDINGQEQTVLAGRQFYAQYPPEDIIPSLAVMEDYGDNNSYVLRMWEAVKSGSLPTMVIIVLSIEAGIVLVIACYFLFKNGVSKNLRHKRKQARQDLSK
jgi:spermidine/putrescine transport system substrate-binding protein